MAARQIQLLNAKLAALYRRCLGPAQVQPWDRPLHVAVAL